MKFSTPLLVLDLSSVLAGPSVGSFFAELGARVIKWENLKTHGDVTRSWRLASEDKSTPVSAYYASVNYLKETELVDLQDPHVQNRLRGLLKEADILIQNYKPSDLGKFGLEPEALKNAFPKLIHCHLTGFRSRPERVAYDVVLQAETGFMSMNGTPESGPVKMPVALIDVLAAHHMKEAILFALYRRSETGQGGYFTITLEEAALSSLTNQASNYLMAGAVAERIGSRHPNIAPYGDQFTAADGTELVLAVGSDRQFDQLCDILGIPDLPNDERFSTNARRVQSRTELIRILAEAIQGVDGKHFLETCHTQRIPAGQIKNLQQVFDEPLAKEMVRSEIQEGIHTRRVTSVAFREE